MVKIPLRGYQLITNKMIEFLKGKKAYLVGLVTVVLGLLNGDTQMVLQGLGIITLRAGIAKV